MASDILGLFASPQQYEQQRQAAMEEQALRMAKLSPVEQGRFGIAYGAQQLGRAIGGALGGVDPQLQKITQRQQLLGMIDPNNPDSYAQAIQTALQAGDQEAAFLLRNEMMRVQEQASVAENRRMESMALSLANGIDPETRQPTKPLFDPITRTFNQDVADQLISRFPTVGADIVKTRLESVQGIGSLQEKQAAKMQEAQAREKAKLLFTPDGAIDKNVYIELITNFGQAGQNAIDRVLKGRESIKSMQAQQLAQGLYKEDGTLNLTIVAELRKTPEGRKILEENAPKKLNITAKVQEAEAYASKFGAEGTIEYNNAYKAYLQGSEKLSDKQTVSNAVSGLKADLRILEKQPQPNQEAIQRIKDQIQSLEPDKQNVTKIGVAKASGKAVYFDKETDQQFVLGRSPTDPNKQIRVLFEGDVDQTTSNVSATASQKQETAFSEQLGKIDAKKVEDAMGLRDNAISALGTLERLAKLDEKGLISGSFATNRVGAANILATIGLISEKDQGILAASQNYQKTSGDLVLATLGGRLGAGFSNEDRKFILSLVPQLETNALARKQLIEFMVKKNRDIITETTRLDDYAREKKSLKGFVPKIPIFNVGSSSLTTMSDADLIKQAEARGIKVKPK
jgi:hypothetical protein